MEVLQAAHRRRLAVKGRTECRKAEVFGLVENGFIWLRKYSLLVTWMGDRKSFWELRGGYFRLRT